MKILRMTIVGLIVTVLLPLIIFNPGVAAETFHTQRSFTPVRGGTVKLDLAFHQIEVIVDQTDKVSIDFNMEADGFGANAMIKRYRPVFRVENGVITVRSQSDQPPLFHWGRRSGKVQVRLPKGINLDLHTSSGDCIIRGDLGDAGVKCDLSSGKLDIDGAMNGLSADLSSGAMMFNAKRLVHSVDINCSSGDLWLTGPMALVKLEVSSGNADLQGLTGSLISKMSSGKLNAKWQSFAIGSQIDARSSSGTVRLSLPVDTILCGDIKTVSGQIHSDFPGVTHDPNSFSYEDQRVGVGIHVDVASGDVWVEKN